VLETQVSLEDDWAVYREKTSMSISGVNPVQESGNQIVYGLYVLRRGETALQYLCVCLLFFLFFLGYR